MLKNKENKFYRPDCKRSVKNDRNEWEKIPFSDKERDSLQPIYTIFLKYTDNLFCIDIDDSNIKSMDDFVRQTGCDTFKDCCWVVGNTKGIHIYTKINNMIEYTNQVDVYKMFKGDLIHAQNNMWEKIDKHVHNYNGKISELEYEEIKDVFNDDRLNPKKQKRCYQIKDSVAAAAADDSSSQNSPSTKKPKFGEYEPQPTFKKQAGQNQNELQEKADIISVKYIDCYSDWFKILCSLKNDSVANYNIALHITKKSKHFRTEQYLKDQWNKIAVGEYKYTLGTFNYYAKCSNEKQYYEIVSKNRQKEIDTVLKLPTEENIAKCFYSLFGEDFLYSNDIVYHWNGIVWEQSKTALRRVFTSTFTQIFINCQISNLNDMKNHDADSEEYKSMTEKNKTFTKVIILLQSNRVIKNVCNDAIKIYIENNNVTFEKNPYTFCFNDKVFDLKTCQFVEPTKDDFMTLTTGYDYKEPTPEEIKSIETALKQVFPNQEERKLFLILLSLTLFGKTIEKFVIMTGSGRNGKGYINELNMKMLGNYGYTCGNAVLLSPIKDGANQSIANMNNKRGIVYREPDSGTYSKINACTVKELTGGSEINARGLYSSVTTTNLRGTHFLECNTKPDMSGDIDDAITMRLIIIQFVSTFTKNVEEVDECNNIFLGNDNFKEPFYQEQHRCALFEILIRYWKLIKDDMNIDKFIPSMVRDRVKDYMSNSNKLMSWFNNNYEPVDDDKEVIVIKEVYHFYRDSIAYLNLNKEEKRKTNEKSVVEFFEKNPFTRKLYRERDQRESTKTKYGKGLRNVLVGYKQIVENNNDD